MRVEGDGTGTSRRLFPATQRQEVNTSGAHLFAVLCMLMSPICVALPGTASLIAAHPGVSGAYVLEKGEESLLARAWLVDHAERSIDIQYFIWSTDNIGILAAEALLRAAERGVQVRVIVDDFLIDAPADSLIALARHPNVAIRIYNPQGSVGMSWLQRLWKVVTDFRSVNQRMHDKTLMVDNQVAITGGRNVADEYYDYDHDYNFRDRDVLLIGPVVGDMAESFERFWSSPLASPVEALLESASRALSDAGVQRIYADLHEYANDVGNFEPQVRQALSHLEQQFGRLLDGLVWQDVLFISDAPGKNSGRSGLGGGGETTRQLARVLSGARREVIIQSPYLVVPDGGFELFQELIDRGVTISISTNSLASTDNLQAFSGYAKQRGKLLDMGVQLREFRPDPAIEADLIERFAALEKTAPIFAIHAKTLVVDRQILYIGTFNLDPRSANLNTEVGVLIDDSGLANQVRTRILNDMQPENSWNLNAQEPHDKVAFSRRMQLWFWRLLPITPLL